MNVLAVLKDEGYIRDYKDIEIRKGINSIQIDLKYFNGTPVIKEIKRINVGFYPTEVEGPHGITIDPVSAQESC